MSMPQPAKVATPEAAFVGLAVQAKVAPPGVVMLRVTEALLTVTVLPLTSCTATTGWVVNAAAPVAPEGLVVKASLVAGPAVAQVLPAEGVLALSAEAT